MLTNPFPHFKIRKSQLFFITTGFFIPNYYINFGLGSTIHYRERCCGAIVVIEIFVISIKKIPVDTNEATSKYITLINIFMKTLHSSHNSPFKSEMGTFLFRMVHCGMPSTLYCVWVAAELPINMLPVLSVTVKQPWTIWVGSCMEGGCFVTRFCYQLIAKPGNKTTTPLRPCPLSGIKCITWNHNDKWYHHNKAKENKTTTSPYIRCEILYMRWF